VQKIEDIQAWEWVQELEIQVLQALKSTQEAIIQNMRGKLRRICEDEDDDLDDLTMDNYDEEDRYSEED
jgi:DNA transposition AAA+ family ATPase